MIKKKWNLLRGMKRREKMILSHLHNYKLTNHYFFLYNPSVRIFYLHIFCMYVFFCVCIWDQHKYYKLSSHYFFYTIRVYAYFMCVSFICINIFVYIYEISININVGFCHTNAFWIIYMYKWHLTQKMFWYDIWRK